MAVVFPFYPLILVINNIALCAVFKDLKITVSKARQIFSVFFCRSYSMLLLKMRYFQRKYTEKMIFPLVIGVFLLYLLKIKTNL